VTLVTRVKKVNRVILALMVKTVTPVFKVLLALRVTQESKEFKVTLVLVVNKVPLVLLEKQVRKEILVKKAQQGSKVMRVLLELLGKTV
jgi:hypothetical protein